MITVNQLPDIPIKQCEPHFGPQVPQFFPRFNQFLHVWHLTKLMVIRRCATLRDSRPSLINGHFDGHYSVLGQSSRPSRRAHSPHWTLGIEASWTGRPGSEVAWV
ncbi:hypothetical protein RRG08_045700 [Elysia crispata]|uniref:Uncharacterized protein n=1 Tax=Elysia crispata TaxID=231223 RepID=A0AAE1D9L9_9GAST|nr:hypothetical protein RRG08_045700 [Elysia crispata]